MLFSYFFTRHRVVLICIFSPVCVTTDSKLQISWLQLTRRTSDLVRKRRLGEFYSTKLYLNTNITLFYFYFNVTNPWQLLIIVVFFIIGSGNALLTPKENWNNCTAKWHHLVVIICIIRACFELAALVTGREYMKHMAGLGYISTNALPITCRQCTFHITSAP